MRPGSRVLLLITAAAVITVVGAGVSGAATTSRIVFAADRSPSTSGDVYRLTLTGKRIDLSNNPAPDSAPTVSPNGKTVAFLSSRGGQIAIYVVGINGTGLRRISPLLGAYPAIGLFFDASIVWSPDGKQLAVQLLNFNVGRVYLVNASGGGWRTISLPGDVASAAPSWSPDGRWLAYIGGKSSNEVRILDRTGRSHWSVPGKGAFWSAQDRLAVQVSKTKIAVYGAPADKLASFAGEWAAWSPDGTQLATLTAKGTLYLHARGSGEPILAGAGWGFDVALEDPSDTAIEWVNAKTVAISNKFKWAGYNVVSRTNVTLRGPFADAAGVLSPDRKYAAVSVLGPNTATLAVARSGGRATTIAKAASCGIGDPYDELAFVPSDRSLIYVSGCYSPPGDLYSVNPDGSGLQQLTDSTADEVEPSLSPDGSTIAYVHQAPIFCFKCGNTIWSAGADGRDPRQLTAPAAPSADESPPFDDYPSFSPDGSTILFARSTGPSGFLADPSASGLYEVGASGGQSTALGVVGSQPSWGPAQLAYLNDKGALTTSNPDGSNPQPLTYKGQPIGGFTAWSSDGRLAVYGGSGAEALIYLSTGNVILLPGLQLSLNDGGITWSPDGSELAFIAENSEGIADVYTVHADGTGLDRLTHDLGATRGVSWR